MVGIRAPAERERARRARGQGVGASGEQGDDVRTGRPSGERGNRPGGGLKSGRRSGSGVARCWGPIGRHGARGGRVPALLPAAA
jgi:hypothetical protein